MPQQSLADKPSNETGSGETIEFLYDEDSTAIETKSASFPLNPGDGANDAYSLDQFHGFSGCFGIGKLDEKAGDIIVSQYLGNHTSANLHHWSIYDTKPSTISSSSSTAYCGEDWEQLHQSEFLDLNDSGSVVHHSIPRKSLVAPAVLSLRRTSSFESDPGDLHVSHLCFHKHGQRSAEEAAPINPLPDRKAAPSPATLAQHPGRFSLKIPHHQPRTIKFSFGQPLHANGQLLNTAFVADERMSNPHTQEGHLRQHPSFIALFQHAEQRLDTQNRKASNRSSAQSMIRREYHRECALARLEGVPVGYYRYFAGGLTVEDYLRARLCVCWKECYCQRLCSRFGDMICPCSGDIVPFEPY